MKHQSTSLENKGLLFVIKEAKSFLCVFSGGCRRFVVADVSEFRWPELGITSKKAAYLRKLKFNE